MCFILQTLRDTERERDPAILVNTRSMFLMSTHANIQTEWSSGPYGMLCLVSKENKNKNHQPQDINHTKKWTDVTYLSPCLCYTGVQIIWVKHQQSLAGIVQLATNVQVGTNHCR